MEYCKVFIINNQGFLNEREPFTEIANKPSMKSFHLW